MRHWLETQNGGRFDLDSDDPEFDIPGMAWGCARQPRYGGQWRPDVEWYSVAEHSLLVHAIVSRFTPLATTQKGARERQRIVRSALCHDLTEGILGDVASPLKRLLPAYEEIEDRMNRALARRLDLIYPWPQIVKDADLRIMVDETRALLSERDRADWKVLDGLGPFGAAIRQWSPRVAAGHFLRALADCGVTD